MTGLSEGSSTAPGRPRTAYVLLVELVDMPYPVWRRVVVDAGMTLHGLHRSIQTVMPWKDYHLYSFSVDRVEYAHPDVNDEELDYEDSTSVRLSDLGLSAGQRLTYLYDFGDHWVHAVEVETVLSEADGPLPRCVDGQGACPPEDVGGVTGFKLFLDAMRDPRHPEHNEYRIWAGGVFDPDQIDVFRLDARMRPDEYWKTRMPCPGLHPEEYVGLWFGYADEVFLQELARQRSPATVRKYENVLHLFQAFMAGYQDISAWPEVTAAHFRQFLGDFAPRKVAPSAREARNMVSGLAGFVRWLDRTYGTSLGEVYAPVRKDYQDALPRAALAADSLSEFVWQGRTAALLEALESVGTNQVLELAAAKRGDTVPEVEGFWDVVEAREDGTVILSEDLVDWSEDSRAPRPAPGGIVTLMLPAEIARLLTPGSSLYLALRRQGRQWAVLASGAVLPPP